ncbi:FAD:protein FMN transferase [Flavicella marina]|uniref:FAD:protein FMN transferase n=1 Tax=Flavicella marina TaxID=1475951 RepID=UPI0012649708|nr:FAD:protein FMN transferase [Flavicella marina]
MIKIKSLLIYFAISMLVASCAKTEPKQHKLEGNVFGTNFHITYIDDRSENFNHAIDSLFQLVNSSLSTYSDVSIISKINKGDTTIVVDTLFSEVYYKAAKIYRETNGVFDPTIGVLVNAWGFGPEKKLEGLNAETISKLMERVGYDKIKLIDHKIQKEHPDIYLDFNAIAKGFGVDVIARYLEAKNIENYMVEIGGEVRVKGKNFKNHFWRIGIEKPNFDGTRSLQQIVELHDEAMATSGNYRKFKIDASTGEKYVHTIDTKTGYTAKRDLLSASVIAPIDCADVDGYATSFMAMGLNQTKLFLEKHPELKVFLIYLDKEGKTKEYCNFSLGN